jgi:hypothetical protein
LLDQASTVQQQVGTLGVSDFFGAKIHKKNPAGKFDEMVYPERWTQTVTSHSLLHWYLTLFMDLLHVLLIERMAEVMGDEVLQESPLRVWNPFRGWRFESGGWSYWTQYGS